MGQTHARVRVSAAGAGVGLALTAWGLCRCVASEWALVRAPGPATLDEAVVLLAAAAALLLETWFVLATAAAVLARLPGAPGWLGRRLAIGCAPRVSHRIAAALLGAAAIGTIAPATVAPAALAAAAPPPGGTQSATSSIESAVSLPPPAFSPADELAPPGWTPTRPPVRPQASPGLLGGAPGPSTGGSVVVHRGDTLWDIVRRHLGPQASDAEIAEGWPGWYAANRGVIGADPDLLLPGQVLRPPPSPAQLSTPHHPGGHR